jgi:hypothetical protein
MKRVLDFIRQNLLVCAISALSLGIYGYLTLSGKECFNCKRTEIYKTGQRSNTYLRFRHK